MEDANLPASHPPQNTPGGIARCPSPTVRLSDYRVGGKRPRPAPHISNSPLRNTLNAHRPSRWSRNAHRTGGVNGGPKHPQETRYPCGPRPMRLEITFEGIGLEAMLSGFAPIFACRHRPHVEIRTRHDKTGRPLAILFPMPQSASPKVKCQTIRFGIRHKDIAFATRWTSPWVASNFAGGFPVSLPSCTPMILHAEVEVHRAGSQTVGSPVNPSVADASVRSNTSAERSPAAMTVSCGPTATARRAFMPVTPGHSA